MVQRDIDVEALYQVTHERKAGELTPCLWTGKIRDSDKHECGAKVFVKFKDAIKFGNVDSLISSMREVDVNHLFYIEGTHRVSVWGSTWKGRAHTALQWSLLFGDIEIFKILLMDDRIDVNKTTSPLHSLLVVAAVNGPARARFYELLFIKEKLDTASPLVYFSSCPVVLPEEVRFSESICLAAVKLLLKTKGVHPNTAISDTTTALYAASARGNVHIVRALLATDLVDVNKATMEWVTVNGNGFGTNDNVTSPLRACANGHRLVVESLVAQSDIAVNEPNSSGATPLLQVASNGDVDLVKLLLRQPGIDLNLQSKSGTAPLFAASSKGHVEIVKELLQQSDIAVNTAEYSTGWTPLHGASHLGFVEIVKLLLEHSKIDFDEASNQGNTALKNVLRYSTSEARDEIVALLTKRKRDFDRISRGLPLPTPRPAAGSPIVRRSQRKTKRTKK
ncbi:hypothetical protein TrVE_jg3692 [Triparma verrucosa]|uniref:Uncharacterized protein n=1 Tax=Triparma verrucosa TaxID=1606542 RepID=A0A9W6ZBT2_9STRA|nr:hypothetical protein TrVE_jg3692 [Triparma verrucosa]